jgi:hypothetical protein
MKKHVVLLVSLLVLFSSLKLRSDTYNYLDTLRLMVATYDTTTYPTLTNADSVVWYRLNYSGTNQRLGAQTTGDVGSGIYSYKVAACSSSSASYVGSYSAYAKVYKGGKTGAKTWTWKAEIPKTDSLLFGRWRASGDSSNVLVDLDNDTLKHAELTARERDTLRNFDRFSGTLATSQFEAGYFAISNFTGTWASTQFSAGYYHGIALASDSGAVIDSVNKVGRISTNLDKTLYRLSSQGVVDVWTDDTTGENSGWAQFFKGRLDTDISRLDTITLQAAKLLAGRGNRQIYYYNSKGYMDSMRYYDGPNLIARWIYYRPADTLAPDSTRSYNY